MVKRKHPHNRAERLALKLEHEDKDRPGLARKRYVEALKQEEADRELKQVADSLATKGSD